jgi:hypothetical protein|nr:MAG TPA: hypothetical protein [Caudoviricetes sp.]
MKMNKKQQEQFDDYATKFARDLKNIFTFESSERYLKQQSMWKWSAFCVEYLARYNVFGDMEADELIENQSLYRKYEKIVIPVFRECIQELGIEREERIKEERRKAKEESDKKGHKRKRNNS